MLPGGSIPLFRAPDTRGIERGTELHWQRRDQLLLLLHGAPSDPCRPLWARMREEEPRLRLDELAVIGVFEGNPDLTPDGAIPDPSGELSTRVRAALGLETAGGELIVATRFGRLVHLLDAHAGPAEVVLADALEWLRYGQIACEDCSQPLWE